MKHKKVSEILKSVLNDNPEKAQLPGLNMDYRYSVFAVRKAVMCIYCRFNGNLQEAIKYAESTGN